MATLKRKAQEALAVGRGQLRNPSGDTRYFSGTLFGLTFLGLLIKAEQYEKGYPYCYWVNYWGT